LATPKRDGSTERSSALASNGHAMAVTAVDRRSVDAAFLVMADDDGCQ
jgi:hypothetical protein